jgi:hypothetical protein
MSAKSGDRGKRGEREVVALAKQDYRFAFACQTCVLSSLRIKESVRFAGCALVPGTQA